MSAWHLYPGGDGESHFESIALEPLTQWAQPGVNVVFVNGKAGFTDFHNSRRPHILTVLSGKMELTASDGTNRTVGPGDCVFLEDVTGKGHSAKILDSEPFRLSIATLAQH